MELPTGRSSPAVSRKPSWWWRAWAGFGVVVVVVVIVKMYVIRGCLQTLKAKQKLKRRLSFSGSEACQVGMGA